MLTVTARHAVIGYHAWPAAPERRAYLRDLHRHEFRVAATVLVDHAERDTEFHDLADELDVELRAIAKSRADSWTVPGTAGGVGGLIFGAQSVETIATKLAGALAERGYVPITVTVSEDGQHDGTWTTDRMLPKGMRELTRSGRA